MDINNQEVKWFGLCSVQLRIRTKIDTRMEKRGTFSLLKIQDTVQGYNSKTRMRIFSGTNILLRVVFKAAGVDEFLQPRRTTRRTNGASMLAACETQAEEDDDEKVLMRTQI